MASTISSSSSMTQEKELIKQLVQLSSKENHNYSSKVIQEEVFAAKTMRNLTNRFGTKGKTAKAIFLQGFRDEVMGKGKKRFLKILHQHDPDDIRSIRDDASVVNKAHTTKAHDEHSVTNQSKSSDSSKILIRPAAMVLYSKFCNRLEMSVKNQVFHLGLVPPLVETSWLYDDARQDSFKLQRNETSLEDIGFEVINVKDILDETEEKMVARLKIYKRAFSCLILHCEALRPILREIKRSYESVLKLRDRQLLEISWITQNILTAEKDIQDKIENVGFEAFGIIKLMDNQCKQLMRHIDKQDSTIRVMTNILNKLENSLGEQHELRRDSDDQNKMFINDINHLRKKLGMSPRPEEGLGEVIQVDEEIQEDITDNIELFKYTPDDPLILRKALDIARHDLVHANKRLEELEDKHKDEIPRHRFEEMKVALSNLLVKLESLKLKTDETQLQVQSTKDQIEKLSSERDDLKKEAIELKIKITPRPSWDKVGEFIDGGLTKWKGIYEGKSSIEVSNKVIEELNAKKTASAPEYLSALGMDPDIPRCLQYDKRVRDRRLERRDAEVIIQDIWKSRIDYLLEMVKKMNETTETNLDDFDNSITDQVPNVENFPEFVAQYFEEKFPNVSRRMEWTYNLLDACTRLTMNQKLVQFKGILMNRIDEGCYHLLRSELLTLHQILKQRSIELGHPEGTMTLGDFKKLIEQIYPHKNEDEIKGLVRVTSKQIKAHADWTIIKYNQLFIETEEGFEGEFVEEFSKQLDEDRLKYVSEIVQGLLLDLGLHYDYHEHEEDPIGDTLVQMKQFYTTLVAVDSNISEENIGAALSWVYARTSTLPGLGSKELLMVSYIKSRLHAPETSGNQIDDVEFERAFNDLKFNSIKSGEVSEETGYKHQHGKVSLGPSKSIKLRVLIRRLQEGAFMSTKIKTPSSGSMKTVRYEDENLGEDEEDYEHFNEDQEEDR